MKIGFIGAGKVGTAFGIYLMNNKLNVVGYYSKSFSSAKKAAIFTDSNAYEELNDFVRDIDIIAITTPDDVIESIATKLVKYQDLLNNKIVFHMSGAHTSQILSSLEAWNVTTLSLHPMLSITDSINSVKELRNTILTIEGSGDRYIEVKELIEQLGNQLIEISTENKVLYHTALTVLSNYLVAVVDVGQEMLKRSGFSEQEAKELAKPLSVQTLNNIFQSSTKEALTGPISRGDIGTINMHIKKLNEINIEWLSIYKALGKHTIKIAGKANKIDYDTAKKLLEVLSEYE